MPPVAAIAGSLLSGPIGGVVSSIAGNIGGSLLGGVGGAGGQGGPLGGVGNIVNKALGGIKNAFGKLFGRKRKSRGFPSFPTMPLPFSPGAGGGFNINTLNNPLGQLGNLSQALGPAGNILQQLAQKLGGSGSKGGLQVGIGGEAGKPPSFPTPPTGQFGGNIDAMMDQAETLMKSDKLMDQIKGQTLMMKASNLFSLISKMIEMKSQMMRTAIQNIR